MDTIVVYMQTLTSSWTENAHLCIGVKSELARVPSKYNLMNLAVTTASPKSSSPGVQFETAKRGPLNSSNSLSEISRPSGLSQSAQSVASSPSSFHVILPYFHRNEMLSHWWFDHTSTMGFNLAEDGDSEDVVCCSSPVVTNETSTDTFIFTESNNSSDE